MLRTAASRLVTASFRVASRSKSTGTSLSSQRVVRPTVSAWVVQRRQFSSQEEENPDQFDARWEAYFNDPNLDAWSLKRGLNELYGHDLVPEPKIVVAMLKAARRVNDVAMAIRILEAVKDKAAGDATIYSYIIESVKPTLEELGISTPEELGLDTA